MSLELPRRLRVDRLSALLILCCGVVLEAALWRHPGLPGGAGIVTAGLLWTWHLRRMREVPTQAVWGPDGWHLLLADGRWTDAALGHGTRLLGPSVVLHWHADGRSYRAWLTAADLPRPLMRSLALRLLAHARVVGP